MAPGATNRTETAGLFPLRVLYSPHARHEEMREAGGTKKKGPGDLSRGHALRKVFVAPAP